MEHDSDEDAPQLSMETFTALQEFYQEQENRESSLQEAILASHNDVDILNIQEDWQLSQFWYNEDTISKLANMAIEIVGKDGKFALISCPSIYSSIKSKLGENGEVNLYEYDKRFSIYGPDFNFYDYKTPLGVPRDKSGYYDLVIADPPFLSDECLTKTSVTMKYLSKDKIILCTGAIMAPMADRLLSLKKIDFKPQHKNNLGNEFWCFANFEVVL